MVFARLGGAHGFTRESRVDVASLQAATRDLVREREALLRERERLVAARKVEKRAGRRGSSSPALPALEGRQRALTALQTGSAYRLSLLLALTAAQHDDLLGLAQALQPHGWRLHFATQQNG